MTADSGKPVLVTTEYRGVFFGYADNTDGDTIILKNMRNCIYWSAAVGGVFGLAATGPDNQCRIGARVSEFQARKVTSVVAVEPAAVRAWEAANVHRG